MSDKPKHDVTIDVALIQAISDLVNPHLRQLNEAVTERWPVAPDMYLSLAIAWQVSVLLGNLSDPDDRLAAIDGMNALIRHTGFALRAVS